MQGIYNHVPEINPVSRIDNVAPILLLQFMVQVISHYQRFVLLH
jgi:hypothetical protein